MQTGRDAGSSPLARGLQRVLLQVKEHVRIIPARAGFTCWVPADPEGLRDHPRSRGVYPAASTMASLVGGSSPLARGLRNIVRAGTNVERHHPRSRGVYEYEGQMSVYWYGSSPLARGLRVQRQTCRRGRGIIPARAGFTLASSAVADVDWDHPRSRGVYTAAVAPIAVLQGSSPLARGLPSPARHHQTPCPDHPRSRGVYVSDLQDIPPEEGSSPLARGLHPHLRGNQTGLRIIPARAGFTGADLLKLDVDTGSSPLARGLQPSAG